MAKATYQFIKPFVFIGKPYHDSRSLAEAFIANWDLAVSVFRRGDMWRFWRNYVGDLYLHDVHIQSMYDEIWCRVMKREVAKDSVYLCHEDFLFLKVLYYLEPNLDGIPILFPEAETARLFSMSEFSSLVQECFGDSNSLYFPEEEYDQINEEHFIRMWLKKAAQEKIFSTFDAGLTSPEKALLREQSGKALKELLLGLTKEPYYVVGEKLCKSWDEVLTAFDSSSVKKLFDMMKQLEDNWDSKKLGQDLTAVLSEEEKPVVKELFEAWKKLKEQADTEALADWCQNKVLAKKSQNPVQDTKAYYVLKYKKYYPQRDLKFADEFLQLQTEQLEAVRKNLDDYNAIQTFFEATKRVNLVCREWKNFEIQKHIDECNQTIAAGEKQVALAVRVRQAMERKDYVTAWDEYPDVDTKLLFAHVGLIPNVYENYEEDLLDSFMDRIRQYLTEMDTVEALNQFVAEFLPLYFRVKKCVTRKCKINVMDSLESMIFCAEDLDSFVHSCVRKNFYKLKDCEDTGCPKMLRQFSDSEDLRYIMLEYQSACERRTDKSLGEKLGEFKAFEKKHLIPYEPERLPLIKDLTGKDYETYTQQFQETLTEYEKLCDEIRMVSKEYSTAFQGNWMFSFRGDLSKEREKREKTAKMHGEKLLELYDKLSNIIPEKYEQVKALEAKRLSAWKVLKAEYDLKEKQLREKKQEEEKKELLRRQKEDAERREKERKEREKRRKKKEKEEKAKRRKEEVRKRLKKVWDTLLTILLFPFLQIPSMLNSRYKRNHRRDMSNVKYIAVIALEVIVYGVVIFFGVRLLGPTYYGTEHYYGTKLGYRHYQVAKGVDEVPQELYRGVERMVSIKLPESLQRIGYQAFADCVNLEEVILPANVYSIDSGAFRNCMNLEKVTVLSESENLEIGSEAFENCVSLQSVDNPGEISDFEEKLFMANAVKGCRNFDTGDYAGLFFAYVPKEDKLLENEQQVKNALKTYDIVYENGTTGRYSPVTDNIRNLVIGEEVVKEEERHVSFVCTLDKGYVQYKLEGTIQAPLEDSTLQLCSGSVVCREAKLSVTEEGPYPEAQYEELVKLLRSMPYQGKNSEHLFAENEVKIEEAYLSLVQASESNEMADVSSPEYLLSVKTTVKDGFEECRFMGGIYFSEEEMFLARNGVYQSEYMPMNLIGTYKYMEGSGTGSSFTIDKQFEDVYVVTEDGEKKMLLLDTESGRGSLVAASGEEYAVSDVYIDNAIPALVLGDCVYERVSEEFTPFEAEQENPLIGIWEGTADIHGNVFNKHYILPLGDRLASIFKFGPSDENPGFQEGIILENIVWNQDANEVVLESKAWLEHPEGYKLRVYNGKFSENRTRIKGDSYYTFDIKKQKPSNLQQEVKSDNWSIYRQDGSYNQELFVVKGNIPDDALAFNGSYYYFYNGCQTWQDAQAYCKSLGGNLAVIKTKEEDTFLHNRFLELGENVLAFGASDEAKEGEWFWVNGDRVDDSGYSNWGERDNHKGKEHYAGYYIEFSDGKWNDSSFADNTFFICEWSVEW